MEERQIGATELRQKLTDVIQAVKEEKVAYIVETFGRPQVVIVELEEFRRLQQSRPEGAPMDAQALAAFGMWRERDDLDAAWLTRNREQWYSAWQVSEDAGE
ncbi:MAG: type II toxin-antitoxin system prevent-host-death family antitoxin [Anaerolineae bacterium]|nr:type II toxin-antitoxin system prevent-host-death family antitoxin [Anaerolineae bacterium]